MDGKNLVVAGSLTILVVSVVLAILGLSQAIVSLIISAVGTGAGILWKWLERTRQQATSASNQRKAPTFVINEAPTLGGKRREDFGVGMEEGETITIIVKATEGRFSAGWFSETDYQLLNRSENYDEEWYYPKNRGTMRRKFKAPRKGTWYLVVWNEESYPLQLSVKVQSVMGDLSKETA